MTIHIEPERGVPTRKAPDMKDLAIKTSAAAKTVEYLHANGLEVEATSEDKDNAAALAVAYAENPHKTSKVCNAETSGPVDTRDFIADR